MFFQAEKNMGVYQKKNSEPLTSSTWYRIILYMHEPVQSGLTRKQLQLQLPNFGNLCCEYLLSNACEKSQSQKFYSESKFLKNIKIIL